MAPAGNVEAGPHRPMIQASLDHVEIPWVRTVSQEEDAFGTFWVEPPPKENTVSPKSRPEPFTCQAIAYLDDAMDPATPMQRSSTMENALFVGLGIDFVGGKTDALPSISPKEEKALIPKIGRFASSGLICGNPNESESEEDCAAKPTCRLIRTESFRIPGAVTTPTRRKRSASALATPHAPGYRIAFVVNGSRGDLIPSLAVARLLIRKENRVHMFTNVDLCKIAEEFGIDSTPIFANMHWVITEIGGVGGTAMDMWREGRKAAQTYLRENKGICMNASDSLSSSSPS